MTKIEPKEKNLLYSFVIPGLHVKDDRGLGNDGSLLALFLFVGSHTGLLDLGSLFIILKNESEKIH